MFALWLRDLALGARFAGGSGTVLLRSALTAVGIGLGAALLLLAASVPHALQAVTDRGDARDEVYAETAGPPGTAWLMNPDTQFHGKTIRGRVLQADSPTPPLPPGVKAFPAPGEMAVSPALARLLRSSEGALLRERLPYAITQTIGDSGLGGPHELAYYAGSDKVAGHGVRITGFGRALDSEPLGGQLVLLVATALAVLLTPVAVLVAVATRFGAAARDRRMAALRLLGTDLPATRRIAAAEALVTAVAGLVVGAGVFLFARGQARRVEVWDTSVFPADLAPDPLLVVLVAVGLPATAAAGALLALRGVAVEPLGVLRNATPAARGSWWRLLPGAVGLVLLLPLLSGDRPADDVNGFQVAGGVVLLLVGLTAVLPWLVRAATARVRRGPVPWLLGVRRMRADAGTSTRAVNAIAVAVAGAIAVQMLLTSLEGDFSQATGEDPGRADVQVTLFEAPGAAGQFRDLPGVLTAVGLRRTSGAVPDAPRSGPGVTVTIGDCASLAFVAVLDRCAPGDSFTVADPAPAPSGSGGPYFPTADDYRPGATLQFQAPGGGASLTWAVPAAARPARSLPDPYGVSASGILATPEAFTPAATPPLTSVYVQLAPDADRDAVERVRNAAARLDPAAGVHTFVATRRNGTFANIERGLFAGATVTLFLIAVGMSVTMLEQLRERRRPLAALAALGTPRRTLAASVLAQTAVPIAVGTCVAAVGGIGIGALLLGVAHRPVAVDWAYVGTVGALGVAAVLAVTLAGLPPLWRLVRPENLRTE
ncbi:ABC transporter permease [Yinghuangia seranimata]|uniref:ABC transporter permease n=1 Tax=Yinghuangia seranimata TaxID=408067 RepID=UPI00248C837F|nr:FtsX-like permease family protein [Yinghuangia seranimata]MDI2126556.1 ABC transporter permease [Yinghuangia seranimata]